MRTLYSLCFLLELSLASGLAADQPSLSRPGDTPFEFLHHAIIVKAFVNGHALTAMIDTGVDPSGVDLASAKELGLHLGSEGDKPSGGGSGANIAYETEFPSVQVGEVRAEHVAALAVNLAQTSQALGRRLDAVLGYSFLRNRIVQIDYPHRVLRFLNGSEPNAEPGRGGNVAVRFTYRNDILVDGARVNGKPVVANLDTGSSARFQLTPSAVTALGLTAQSTSGEVSHSVGINGETESREGYVDSITIGTLRVDHPATVFYGAHTGYDHEAWGLRIGNGFLQDYVVTIDYIHSVILLDPR